MTTYFTDSCTGSNGSSPNSTNFTTLISTTGATAQVQSNQYRLNTGSLGSYSGKMAIRKAGASIADAEWTTKFTINSSTDGAFEVWHRAVAGSSDGTGYYVRIEVGTGNVELRKAVSYSYTLLDSVSGFVVTQGTQYSLKFYCVGTSLKVKIWTGSEPGSYQLSDTDSAVAAAGYSYMAAVGGGSSGYNVDIDDITLTDGAGNAITWTASVTSAGALSRSTTKNPFTGSTTATGVLTKLKVVTALFTGSVTATGAYLKRCGKLLTGAITMSGESLKQIPREFTASTTAVGVFRKSAVRVFAASVTAVGVMATTFLGRVFGRPGRAVLAIVRAAEVKIRVRRT